MAIPTSYTEATLAQFMKDVIGDTADSISWTTVIGKYQEAVNETLIAYGVTDIALATDIAKIRAIARREVWRAVANSTAGNYRFGSDREQYYRDHVYDHAKSEFLSASASAAKYVDDDDSTKASILTVIDEADPYVWVSGQDDVGVE